MVQCTLYIVYSCYLQDFWPVRNLATFKMETSVDFVHGKEGKLNIDVN